MLYSNLINLGQNWISVGLVNFGTLLLALHGGVLLLSLLWLGKRHLGWTLRGSPGKWAGRWSNPSASKRASERAGS